MNQFLIVDDSATARKFIIRCLEMSGCEDATFLEAENGENALKILKEDPVDLVITDLNMPVMNGNQLLLKIKTNPSLTDTVVMLITSAENKDLKEDLMKKGAYEVLGKPISPADMFPILQRLALTGEDIE